MRVAHARRQASRSYFVAFIQALVLVLLYSNAPTSGFIRVVPAFIVDLAA